MNIWYELYLISPHIVLLLAAISTFPIGVFAKKEDGPLLCVLVAIGSIAIALYLAYDITALDRRSYVFDSMLVIDQFTSISVFIILFASIPIFGAFYDIIQYNRVKYFERVTLVLLNLLGLLFLVSSNNFISLYMSLEIVSLSAYVMTAIRRNKILSTEAGLKYFILGSLASCIYLFGVSIVYGMTGDLDFTTMKETYATSNSISDAEILSPAMLIGVVLIIISFCFKLSAVPFHMWTPDVYQGTSSFIVMFFASISKIGVLIAFLRVLFIPFGNFFHAWNQIIVCVSVLSMIVGGLGAIMQTNMKRMLAYSSISHIGFILLGITAGDSNGILSSVVYGMIYITMVIGSFSVIIMLSANKNYNDEISDIRGLYSNSPTVAVLFSLLIFSMAGIPPVAGFVVKLGVICSTLNGGLYYLAIVAVLAASISAFYYLRIIKTMFFDPVPTGYKVTAVPTLSTMTILVICASLNVLYIFVPTGLNTMIKYAILHGNMA